MRAFSVLELLLVVAIVGILGSLALQQYSYKESACVENLIQNLQNLQDDIAQYFTKQYLLQSRARMQLNDLMQSLMQNRQLSNPRCSILINNDKITMTSYGLKTTFTLTPTTEFSAPKISCPLSNELCKKINHRLSKK